MEENKNEYFLDENGDNLNLEIDAPIVRAIPIQKSLNWKRFNDSAKAYLSGVPIQGLDVDPNSKYSKSWAHNVNSFAKAVAENRSYAISPYKQYTATDLHELARYFNNFSLNTSKINFGNIKPKKLVKDYVKDHPEASEETQQELLEQYKRLKVNEQTNKRTFKTARRYAGSDQQSIADRQFYKNLGTTLGLIGTGIPAGYLATGLLAGAAYTAPVWAPFVVKNMVLPWLGSEVVNRATNWMTDGKYNSFGDWFYNETPLNELTEDTWLETPTRFVADMTNFGYWAPYKKISTSLFHSIPNWMEGKAYNIAGDLVGTQIYRNPKAIKSAENILQMIPQQHQYNFAQGVMNGNKTAALNAQNPSQWFTTGGMPNPETTFYSGFPINSKYAFNVTEYMKDFFNRIRFNGRLRLSNKAIDDYFNFQKINPGVKVVYDITPEDVKLRFEDPEVTKIIDEAHNVVWTKNENGFLINYMPVDISKVRVLDDVALNGSDDSWIRDLSDTMEPGTVMLTGRIKDLRLNGNRVEPWFGWVPQYNYNSSYNARAERFLDEAIESASRNKDLESYIESLRNIRNQISNRQFSSLGNTIFADDVSSIRFSTYGEDMHINLPSLIEYRNGVWDAPDESLVRENLDPNNVLGLFDSYPFRRTIIDPYHHVHYTRRNGKYYINSSELSRQFNPENVSIAPHIDFSQAGRDKLESYLRSVDSPDRIVLTGNVSGMHNIIDLSKTPLSRFAPQRIGDYYHMVGISPEFDSEPFGSSRLDLSTPKDLIKPLGRARYYDPLNPLHPEFDIPEVDPKLRDNFINFVESYPGEKLQINNPRKLELLTKIYESFGLGTLPDDIVKKAAMIAEKSASDAAAIAPEISLVSQYPEGYNLIYYRKGKPVGSLNTDYLGYTDVNGKNFNASHIGMIRNLEPTTERGVARSLYSSGIIYDDLFYKYIYPGTGGGLISGEYLLSPEQTIHTILKPNFSTKLFGNYGVHKFNSGQNVEIKKDVEPFVKRNAPVYHITGTTDRIPVKSRDILHPQRIVFKDGKFSLIPLDLNNPSLYRSIVPLIGIGAGAAALSESDN